MIKKIKELYERVRGAVRDFLDKVKGYIHSALKRLRFPTWYFILLHVIAFLVVVETLPTGFLWGTFMVGFVAWAVNKTKVKQ